MATALSVSAKMAWRGSAASGQRGYIGCYDGYNWGMRYTVKTPDMDVGGMTLRTYFFNGTAANLKNYPVRVGISTDASGFLNANGKSGYAGTLSYGVSGSYNAVCEMTFDTPLSPNTTYYIFLYPAFTTSFRHYAYDANVVNQISIGVTEQEAEEIAALPSVLSVAAGTLGTESTLFVARENDGYTHTVTYTCGSENGTICTDSGETQISWTPSMELARQNTTGSEVTVQFTIVTLNGDETIGTNTCSTTFAIPEGVKPTVTSGWAAVSPYNTGTAAVSVSGYVQGYSKAKITFDPGKIDLSGAYGATVAGYTVDVSTDDDGCTGTLSTAGQQSITCTVTDSRGRKASERLTFTVMAYTKPYMTAISVYRSTSAGSASEEGKYIACGATANVSDLNGANSYTLQARYKLQGGAYGDATSLISGQISLLGGTLSSASSYAVELSLTDKLGNVATYTQIVATAEVFFMGKEGGKGAAFGKYAEEDYVLDIAWALRVLLDAEVQGNLNVIRDVSAANLDLSGGVTAKGNVSAEGDVSAKNMTLSGDASVTNLTLSGGVTAKGDVTAEGEVSAKALNASGDVNAEGDLSASNLNLSGGVTAEGDSTVENLNVSGELSAVLRPLTLLWENDGAEDTFAAQTISISAEETDLLLICCENQNGEGMEQWFHCRPGTEGAPKGVYLQLMNHLRLYQRKATITTTAVTFEDCQRIELMDSTGAQTVANKYAYPKAIYSIKSTK